MHVAASEAAKEISMADEHSSALKIAGAYVAAGATWILCSDRLALAITRDPESLYYVALFKGWFFVAVTATLLYWVLTRELRALRLSREELQQRFESLSTAEDELLLQIGKSRQIADELQEANNRYHELVNSIDGIVWELRLPDFQFTYVSERVQAILGYSSAEWLSSPTFWQDHVHPDDREWAVDFCTRATREKRDHQFEYRMFDANGRIVRLRDLVTVVVEDERPVKLRGIMVAATADAAGTAEKSAPI